MTIAESDPERAEITVRFSDDVLDRIDETCRVRGYATRSELVSEALGRAVESEA